VAHVDVGGRPNRRGDSRRAPRLRVTRAQTRRREYDRKRGIAPDLAAEVAVAADYLRSALRGNSAAVTFEDLLLIRKTLDQLAAHADHINQHAATTANREGNTPRSLRRKDPA
jgi:hypothetical protein